jgi:hypothetical protein
MNAFSESIAAQRAAFENSLAEKQAAFDAAKERKLKQIHFVQDSNYKFHLIKLLEAKSQAIAEAIGQARTAFSDVLNAELTRFGEFRDAERSAFEDARQALRNTFADEEITAESNLNSDLQANNDSFDEGLEQALLDLVDGLDEQRELMKTALAQEESYVEEEYTYTEHAAPVHNYSPYSHSAKNQFLAEFHYYLSDQLKKLDAGIDGIAEWSQKEVDAKVEAFGTAVGHSEQRLGDQRLQAQQMLAQLADSLATEYAEAQDLELSAIQEKRAGLEEAIAGKAEELKKKIVYLKKQLHFKGHATDFDNYHLSDAIDALVGEFDAAVTEIRAWFQSNVETEISESTQRANAVGQAFTEAIQRLMTIQATLSAELAQAARDGAIATEEYFVSTTQERLDGFVKVIGSLTEKVEGWYQEKLVWIGGLHDHYYAEELRGKLEAKKQQAYAALADRSAAAAEVVEYRREELSARLGQLVGQFDNTANNELQTLADSSSAEAASLASDIQATAQGFASSLSFEHTGINAFLDDLVKQWVWWLKQYHGYEGYAAEMYEGIPDTGVPGHDAAHDPAYDRHENHHLDPHDIPGYHEIEAFFKRDFVGDLPAIKDNLLDAISGAAGELEVWFATFEDNAEGELEVRRSELQDRLVAAREAIEGALVDVEGEAKARIVVQRDAFIADVADKRAAVEAAVAQLKGNGQYGNEDQKALLAEIHEAKEAFATAVQDARGDFDLILSQAREASESRLVAARGQFETEATRKRGDLDVMINSLRSNLSEVAANKKEALGLVLGAAWEDLEEAVAEKVEAFNWAVQKKVEWINSVHYYGLRHKLLDQVKDLEAKFAADIDGLRSMMADMSEERRLYAEEQLDNDQADFEVFAASVLETCDNNRQIQVGLLEDALKERRRVFDDLIGDCRHVIASAINGEISGLKDFLQTQYGYQGHRPAGQQKTESAYFDEEYVDAVQQYIDHVTAGVAAQGVAAIDWLATRKEALKDGILALNDQIELDQSNRAGFEVEQFASSVDSAMHVSANLAATLLADVQAKNDGIQGTLDDLKHTYHHYQDVHGYRYKLLNQLHHQRVAFEQAVEAAWVTWTQSRELALDTAGATAGQASQDFEAFLATKLGEFDQQAAAARADLADRIAAKSEALKVAAQDATRAFAEKQAYKRHYIAGLQDYHKKERLTAKVDLEDQLYAEAVKGIWTNFQNETDVAVEWLD